MKPSCLGQESYKVGTSTSYKLSSKLPISRVISPQKSQLFSAIKKGDIRYITPFTTGGPGAHLEKTLAAKGCFSFFEFDGCFRTTLDFCHFFLPGCLGVKKGVYIYFSCNHVRNQLNKNHFDMWMFGDVFPRWGSVPTSEWLGILGQDSRLAEHHDAMVQRASQKLEA